MDVLLLANLAATMVMVGVAWFVQVVHYPLMAHVPPAGGAAYAEAHSRRTTRVVAPPMVVEAVTAVALAVRIPAGVPAALPWAGLALVVVIWLSTWRVQVPAHRALARRLDPAAVDRLVRGNRLRTLAWTARGAIVVAMAALAS